jgi:hypothetical protein
MDKLIIYTFLIFALLGLSAAKINNPNSFPNWLNAYEKKKIENKKELVLSQIRSKYLAERYFDNIAHDGTPKTKIYDVKLDATGSFDLDNFDGVRYSWNQIGEKTVKLTNPNSPVIYFEAIEGEYKFKLTVTDAYGASADTTKTITIGAEPNNTPTPIIFVTNEKKPLPPKPKARPKKSKKQREAEEALRKLKKKIGG